MNRVLRDILYVLEGGRKSHRITLSKLDSKSLLWMYEELKIWNLSEEVLKC